MELGKTQKIRIELMKINYILFQLFTFMKKVSPPPPAAAPQTPGTFLGFFGVRTVSPATPQPSELEQCVLEILHQIHADKPFTEIRGK